MHHKRLKMLIIVVSTLTVLLTACNQKDATTAGEAVATPTSPVLQPTTVPAEKSTEEPDKKKKAEQNKSIYSDFVLPVEGIRPYAVMIDNEGTKSLPQGGLDKAQVIYEVIVEGGETRLMPMFWNTLPQLVGPVRSSRHYFLDYAMENDAIYIHFGWSPQAMNDISKYRINNLNGVANGGEVFWDLTKDRYNWQDSYTSLEKVSTYVNKVKYRTATDKKVGFSYNKDDTDISGDKKAENIDIRFSHAYTAGFKYDSSIKAYMRFRKGKPHMERTTNSQLTAKNIIIQFAKNYTIKGDTQGRQEVATVGSGDGWLITNGKAEKIKWSKQSRQAATEYKDEKGNKIMLNPGPTWIQVVPLSGKVEIQ